MKISILCLSLPGYETALALRDILKTEHETEIFRKGKSFPDSIPESLQEWTERHFEEDALIFVSSAGIAVRAIAPLVRSKKTDPAVLVVDDMFHFVIPILSGHLGGANELASQIADAKGAIPVITTSTDIHGKFAPDIFAKKNGLVITDFTKAKEAAATLVRGERVTVYCDSAVVGHIPEEAQIKPLSQLRQLGVPGLSKDDLNGFAIVISPYEKDGTILENELWLIPRTAYLGIGLREGKTREDVERAARACIKQAGITQRAVKRISSVDLKRKEAGLLAYAEALHCDTEFFTGQALGRVPGEFTESEFVRSIAGVGNVCERSALLSAMGDGDETDAALIARKLPLDGVTAAIAIKKGTIRFE